MTQQLLMEILNKRLFLELALLEVTYFISWLVVLKLGFRILRVEVGIKRILTGVLIGASFNLFIKPFLPLPIAAFTQLALVTLFLKVYAREARLINAFWSTFITLIIIFLGTTSIYAPLCSLGKSISSFLLFNPYGIVANTLIETLFPAIALFILSKYNFSMIPPFRGGRPSGLDIVGVFTFGSLFIMVYRSTLDLYLIVKNNPKEIFNYLSDTWLITVVSVLGCYIVLTAIQRQNEIGRRQIELGQELRELEREMFETKTLEMQGKINALTEKNKDLIERNTDLKERNNENKLYVKVFKKLMKKKPKKDKVDVVKVNLTEPDIDEINLADIDLLPVEFTPREQDVLRLLAQWKTNKEMAEALVLVPQRIRNIINEIKSKTHLPDRNKMILYAIKWVKMNDDKQE